jgi:hypothetical protein
VPPSPANTKPGAGDPNSDARRPKHVVLSETIALLKHLQAKVGEDTRVQLPASDPALPRALGVCVCAHRNCSCRHARTHTCRCATMK